MKFTETPIPGAFLVGLEPHTDDRGFFARAFCIEEFAAHGLNGDVVQCSISHNKKKGTVRGMHWQTKPHEEDKLVRCIAGAIFDVLVDCRAGSPTFGKWFGAELSAINRDALFIPKGLAHGFLTLKDDSEIYYQMSVPFAGGFSRGFRWDDPTIGIKWPATPTVISERDAQLPLFSATGTD